MKKLNFCKWVILICIFIIISFYFFKILTYMMKPDNIDLEIIAGFYGEKKNSLDMVYVGGSAAFVYWEPLKAFETNGIASYNFGANTVQPELYKTMIKEILKTQKPELIVIDARAFQYRDQDQKPTEVAYRNVLTGMPLSINKINFINENVKKYLNEDTVSYYFDIIKYHRDTKDIEINNQLKMAFGTFKNENKGFYFVPKVAMQKKIDYETDLKMPVTTETENILIDLLEFLKTTDNKYLFVVSPYIEQEGHKENFNYISEIINNYGYDFLDANDYASEMSIDFDTDFYNSNHVNILGADKYTEFLTNYLLENYDLPNRKEDSNYKEWFELLNEWNLKVNETKQTIKNKIEENENV